MDTGDNSWMIFFPKQQMLIHGSPFKIPFWKTVLIVRHLMQWELLWVPEAQNLFFLFLDPSQGKTVHSLCIWPDANIKYLSCDVCACPSKFSRSSPTLYILTQIQREFPSSINTVASSWHLTQAWQVTAIATTAWEIQETNTGELLERLLKSCVVENIQLHQWPLFKVCCWSDTIINKYFCSLSHK